METIQGVDVDKSDDRTLDQETSKTFVITYKKDQWSPINTMGKKVYDVDFLICLQNNPKCKEKPKNLPDLDVVLKDSNRKRILDIHSTKMSHQPEVLTPVHHKSSKHGSQQKKTSSKRPARLDHGDSMTEDEAETATADLPDSDIIQDASVLHPLMLERNEKNVEGEEKVEKLLTQLQDLVIDNVEKLQGVVDLVYEKAVNEPDLSPAYSRMCKELALIRVPIDSKEENETIEYVSFKKLLIARCEIEFQNLIDEEPNDAKLTEIEECTDPEKKKELQLLLEDNRGMRNKLIRNIRFMGELFKQKMLTFNIMMQCMNILLDNNDEDSLECLCKLLMSAVKDLKQSNQRDLTEYFVKVEEVANEKHGKISSRVRFMLQDVINLRNSKWSWRRRDLIRTNIQINLGSIYDWDDYLVASGSDDDDFWQYCESSKSINMEKIQKEADTKQMNIQMNSGSINTPRKNDRLADSVSGSDRKRRNNASDDGQMTMPLHVRSQYFESSKLMNKPLPMEEMTLGSKNENHTPVTNTTNMYAALENINKSRSGLRDTYSNKDFKNIFDQYSNDCLFLNKCRCIEIKRLLRLRSKPVFVSEGHKYQLKSSTIDRSNTGKFFSHLIKNQVLSLDVYGKSLLINSADPVLCCANFLNYLAEMIVPLIIEDVLTLDKFCSYICVDQDNSYKLLGPLLKRLCAEKGSNYVVNIWKSSGVNFIDFMPEYLINSFIKINKLDFMVCDTNTSEIEGSINWNNIHDELLQLLKANNAFDCITEWISINVGEDITSNQFIRILATAICENAVYLVNDVKKLNIELLDAYCPLLQQYVETREEYELQCLFALQSLVHKWEHPPCLLLNIIKKLWEDGLISNESLNAWAGNNDPAEQKGKDIVLASMQRFFMALNEAEDATTTA